MNKHSPKNAAFCKVCKNQLFPKPLLQYQNMPTVAQNLPDETQLKEDQGVDLSVYQCSGCGLVQLISEPVFYYKEVIRAVAYSPTMKEFRLGQFEEFVSKYNLKNKKILEVGSGKGEYLELMNTTEADTYGIEFSENSVEAAKKAGLKVEKNFIESATRLNEAPFDAFFIISFFEHLPDPNSVLKGIYNNLNPEAIGLVEVPNFDMMLRENLFSEFMKDHLFYFTKKTLTTTLEINGFEVLNIKEIWHDYILSAEVRKKEPLNLSSFNQTIEKTKKEIDDFLNKYSNVAIWGAGHQAFAIMSIMNLGRRIKYIVDSAPFKQGKFSPATHIPIVSPEKLKTDPIDAIILMAGSYNEEIKKIIKEKYDNKIKIAVLKETGLKIEK